MRTDENMNKGYHPDGEEDMPPDVFHGLGKRKN
jgi:hypothetical protein